MYEASRAPKTGERGLATPLDGQDSAVVAVAESNHRIGNNLSIIGGLVLQQALDIERESRSFDGKEVAQLLREVSQRIDMVGRYHRMLAQPGADSSVDLGDFLHEVATAAIRSMANDDLTLEPIPRDRCEIHTSQALLAGFIVGELVTNSLKYAHPPRVKGKIWLTCNTTDGATRITLSDDGVGLPEGFDADNSGGMGLRMARVLAKQLQARLSFSSPGHGLTVELLIPQQP